MRNTLAVGMLACALALTACNSSDDKAEAKPTASAEAPTETTPTPGKAAASTPAELTPGQMASAVAAAGFPPKPDAATKAKYIAAINAISPDLIRKKDGADDIAVSRGRDTCGNIGEKREHAKLVDTVQQRFSGSAIQVSPAQAEKILEVVHTHLCPTF